MHLSMYDILSFMSSDFTWFWPLSILFQMYSLSTWIQATAVQMIFLAFSQHFWMNLSDLHLLMLLLWFIFRSDEGPKSATTPLFICIIWPLLPELAASYDWLRSTVLISLVCFEPGGLSLFLLNRDDISLIWFFKARRLLSSFHSIEGILAAKQLLQAAHEMHVLH